MNTLIHRCKINNKVCIDVICDYRLLLSQTTIPTRCENPAISLKHCSSTNPFLNHPLHPTSLPVSTPNTIHHSRLTVCLPDSLNLTRCLSILFWTSACE